MKLPPNQILDKKKLHKERAKLKKYLKWGDLIRLADLAGVNVQIVYRWFKGEILNSTVGPYIELLAESRKKEIKRKIKEEYGL